MDGKSDRRSSVKHSEPPRGVGKVRYELDKVPAARNLVRICLSESVHGQLGHWDGTCTRVHEEENCEWCVRGAGWKYNLYFFALNVQTRAITIVQMPGGPYPTFLKFLEDHKTLRGCQVVLWRPKGTKMAPVSARLTMPSGDVSWLPACPDITEPLERIFYGGWLKGTKDFIEHDPTPTQTAFVPDLPRGVIPVTRPHANMVAPTAGTIDIENICNVKGGVAGDVAKILRSSRNGKG